MRDIRDYCVNSNDPFHFGLFCVLLLSIDVFLRKVEFQSLSSDNFNSNLFVMTGEFLPEALNLKVKGKIKKTKNQDPGNSGAPNTRFLHLWGE